MPYLIDKTIIVHMLIAMRALLGYHIVVAMNFALAQVHEDEIHREGLMMGGTGPGDARIDSVEQLLAVAAALEREAAARYRQFSERLARQGDAATAAEFAALAELEDRHAVAVDERALSLLGQTAAPLRVGWELPANFDEDEARNAALGAYQALAYAVRNEERAFAFYVYVAAAAGDAALRALAEALASDELEHAAILRRQRRRAFHSERPTALAIPTSVEALQAEARAWRAEAAAAHAQLALALDAAGETGDAAIFRRLAAEEERSASGAVCGAVVALRSADEGLRLLEAGFDRFALIAERAREERVVAEAQRLAGEMVRLLAMAGGARKNSLLATP